MEVRLGRLWVRVVFGAAITGGEAFEAAVSALPLRSSWVCCSSYCFVGVFFFFTC